MFIKFRDFLDSYFGVTPKKAKQYEMDLNAVRCKGFEEGQSLAIRKINEETTVKLSKDYVGKGRKSSVLDVVEIIRSAKPIKLEK